MDNSQENTQTHLCRHCSSMTGTREGLQAVVHGAGYRHLTLKELRESAEKQCRSCEHLLDALGGAFDILPPIRLEDYQDCEAETRLVIKANSRVLQASLACPAEADFDDEAPPLRGVELTALKLGLEVESENRKPESETWPVVRIAAAEGEEDTVWLPRGWNVLLTRFFLPPKPTVQLSSSL